jgi:hypothetical protein
MIDPLTSLAFSIHSGRGIYALLLGSGISRAAEIPTGWEVTLDLIKKIAAVAGEECEPDPASWYLNKFGKEPDYSDLLAGLALAPAERTIALRKYFEATPEDLEEGKKLPTIAHKAIARLVKAGYFRVIVTTNFDRLLEQAFVAEGIDPTVISTPDMALGAPPLAHSNCTIIKVHGDYRDNRLKNTSQELSIYDAETNKLLDRVFDEYGLVICGWSASWDEALRTAIFRSPNRRYSALWAAKGVISEEANELIGFRGASVLPIESADKFFSSLEEKLDALERLGAPHPLSSEAIPRRRSVSNSAPRSCDERGGTANLTIVAVGSDHERAGLRSYLPSFGTVRAQHADYALRNCEWMLLGNTGSSPVMGTCDCEIT